MVSIALNRICTPEVATVHQLHVVAIVSLVVYLIKHLLLLSESLPKGLFEQVFFICEQVEASFERIVTFLFDLVSHGHVNHHCVVFDVDSWLCLPLKEP